MLETTSDVMLRAEQKAALSKTLEDSTLVSYHRFHREPSFGQDRWKLHRGWIHVFKQWRCDWKSWFFWCLGSEAWLRLLIGFDQGSTITMVQFIFSL